LPTDLDLLADSRQLRDPACGCVKVIRQNISFDLRIKIERNGGK
jgi:hypothetical protein